MTPERTCTKLVMHWSDGTISLAEGEHAQKIMEWYNSCELMNCIHGAKFQGEPMIRLTAQEFAQK